MRGLLTYISILGAIIIVLVIMGTRTSSQSVESSPYPSDEKQFMSSVETAYSRAKSANDLQKKDIEKQRDNDICHSLGSDSLVSGWIGEIADISSTSSGNATIELKLSDGIVIETWNNALSDIRDHTIIDKKSDVYKDIYNLSIGSKVVFSGSFIKDDYHCATESSLTTDGSLSSPEFLFKFSHVSVL